MFAERPWCLLEQVPLEAKTLDGRGAGCKLRGSGNLD